MRIAAVVALAGVSLVAGGCADGRDAGDAASAPRQPDRAAARTTVVPRLVPARPYEPGSDEEVANGKRLAARVAQRALTFRAGATSRDVARSLSSASATRQSLARVLDPAVKPRATSVGRVVYPQLSGATSTSLGVMVVVRQTLQAADGAKRVITRVLGVRLRRAGGPWSLDRIESVGGSPVRHPDRLPRQATRVLENRNITLSDTARWDVYAGSVDDALLAALADAARKHAFSIAVFRSGHPPTVWDTERTSAHSVGLAADIYAVGGRPVIAQRLPKGPAYELASALYTGGAAQLGSPWVFGSGGSRSFTDAVHQDHLHVQQSPWQ